MGKVLSIDSYDVTKQIADISANNPDTEMAIAGGGKVINASRFALQHVLEYEGAQKQEGQVSITSELQDETHEKLAKKGYDTVLQGHQHLQKYDHVHDFSEQDKKTIPEQQAPSHILLHRLENGNIRLKAVDTDMQPVQLIIMGRSMDVAEILSDGNQVEEYREVA